MNMIIFSQLINTEPVPISCILLQFNGSVTKKPRGW